MKPIRQKSYQEREPKVQPIWKLVLVFVACVLGTFLTIILIASSGLGPTWLRGIVVAVIFTILVSRQFKNAGPSYRPGISVDPPQELTRRYFMRKHELRKEEERWEATQEERQAYLLALRHRIVQRVIPILIVAFILVLAIIMLRR